VPWQSPPIDAVKAPEGIPAQVHKVKQICTLFFSLRFHHKNYGWAVSPYVAGTSWRVPRPGGTSLRVTPHRSTDSALYKRPYAPWAQTSTVARVRTRSSPRHRCQPPGARLLASGASCSRYAGARAHFSRVTKPGPRPAQAVVGGGGCASPCGVQAFRPQFSSSRGASSSANGRQGRSTAAVVRTTILPPGPSSHPRHPGCSAARPRGQGLATRRATAPHHYLARLAGISSRVGGLVHRLWSGSPPERKVDRRSRPRLMSEPQAHFFMMSCT
jgi:hypothetical protein